MSSQSFEEKYTQDPIDMDEMDQIYKSIANIAPFEGGEIGSTKDVLKFTGRILHSKKKHSYLTEFIIKQKLEKKKEERTRWEHPTRPIPASVPKVRENEYTYYLTYKNPETDQMEGATVMTNVEVAERHRAPPNRINISGRHPRGVPEHKIIISPIDGETRFTGVPSIPAGVGVGMMTDIISLYADNYQKKRETVAGDINSRLKKPTDLTGHAPLKRRRVFATWIGCRGYCDTPWTGMTREELSYQNILDQDYDRDYTFYSPTKGQKLALQIAVSMNPSPDAEAKEKEKKKVESPALAPGYSAQELELYEAKAKAVAKDQARKDAAKLMKGWKSNFSENLPLNMRKALGAKFRFPNPPPRQGGTRRKSHSRKRKHTKGRKHTKKHRRHTKGRKHTKGRRKHTKGRKHTKKHRRHTKGRRKHTK